MKHIFSTIIFLTLIFLSACEAYLDSKYEKYYLEEELIFQYDSGDVFIYENEEGFLDSLKVYNEEQYLRETEDYEKREYQKYELVKDQGLKYYDEYISCIENCRGPGHYECILNCYPEFPDVIIYEFESYANQSKDKKENIYTVLTIKGYWSDEIDNLPGNTYTIDNIDYNNSKILRLNEENLYIPIDSIVFNYMYGILGYRNIEEGWYTLKTIKK